MFNTNAIHNYLNLAGLVVGSLALFDWAGLGWSPEVAAAVSAGFLTADKIIKLAINVWRDGLGGLFKVQPPVV